MEDFRINLWHQRSRTRLHLVCLLPSPISGLHRPSRRPFPTHHPIITSPGTSEKWPSLVTISWSRERAMAAITPSKSPILFPSPRAISARVSERPLLFVVLEDHLGEAHPLRFLEASQPIVCILGYADRLGEHAPIRTCISKSPSLHFTSTTSAPRGEREGEARMIPLRGLLWSRLSPGLSSFHPRLDGRRALRRPKNGWVLARRKNEEE